MCIKCKISKYIRTTRIRTCTMCEWKLACNNWCQKNEHLATIVNGTTFKPHEASLRKGIMHHWKFINTCCTKGQFTLKGRELFLKKHKKVNKTLKNRLVSIIIILSGGSYHWDAIGIHRWHVKTMHVRASLVRVISVIQVFKSGKCYHPEINIVSPFFFFIFSCSFILFCSCCCLASQLTKFVHSHKMRNTMFCL